MLAILIILIAACAGLTAWAVTLKAANARLAEREATALRQADEARSLAKAETERVRRDCEMRLADDERREERFRAMAAEVMQRQELTARAARDNSLQLLLDPLRRDLDGFRKAVTDSYAEESRQRFSLTQHIKTLVEANNSIGREARELARALRGDSKKQGDWGEMILETILEKCGLRPGEEFTVQQTRDAAGHTLTGEDGALLRPDVVVHYPSRGDVVIDSKVSLTAYTDYVNAEDDLQREAALKRHVTSVRSHVGELRRKRYQDYMGGRSLDFVMMFIPNEGAYMSALASNASLWEEALEARVLIVSPTHLVSVLSMIHRLWAEERQSRNAMEIADAAGKMYDKFAGFVEDLERIRRGMDTTRKAYDDAMNKLRDGRGSLMSRAEGLRDLGARATRRLEQGK